MAVGPDGSFTVVWWADEAAGPARDAQMRRFDAAGNALAEVIDVAAGEGEQLYPDVTVLPDGTIVVY